MLDLNNLVVFPLFLIFCRMGAAVMVFPAISDPSINVRARLLTALLISIALWPLLANQMPKMPETTGVMFMFIGMELTMGLLMAMAARLFMAAINVAGEMIAFATGFQAATLFDPVTNANSAAPTIFLTLVAGMLVFATNLHHVLIQGIVDSYTLFPPGNLPKMSDLNLALLSLIQHIFVIGIKISAPIVVVGFLSYVAFGIFNRLIPQLHVFFVALPLSIVVGMFVFAVAMSSMLMLFVTELHNNAILFTQQG